MKFLCDLGLWQIGGVARRKRGVVHGSTLMPVTEYAVYYIMGKYCPAQSPIKALNPNIHVCRFVGDICNVIFDVQICYVVSDIDHEDPSGS